MHLNEVINYFQGIKKLTNNSYQVKCPVHNDDKASLTITEEDNKILMYCHAGCSTENILQAIGLVEKDLFNNIKKEKAKIVAEYIYTDEEYNPLYKVVRFEPKNFMQSKWENGKWIWKMQNVRYVLYNLPNVIDSDYVFFVEGEKDANNLNSIGLVATTTVSGAASFNKRAKEYIEFLKDKKIYIIPDNDDAGRKYAEDVEKAIKPVAKTVKILDLSLEISDLKEKQDISDVLLKFGPEKTKEILKSLINSDKKEEKVEEEFELDEENIFSITLFEQLYRYEVNDLEKYFDLYNKIKTFCTKNRITGFDKSYKKYKDTKENITKKEFSGNNMLLAFPNLDGVVYNTNKYELNEDNFIYEVIPDIGKILVCYHPILPIEKFKNLEDGTEKIKIGFYKNDEWHYMIVEKSLISSSQSIVKLSDFGISVTSENAKHLVKYLAEIENLNKDLIKTNISTSKLGWIGDDVLMPYSDQYEFDNDKDVPDVVEKFGESGKLEDWIEFFKERRKYNSISRIVMAGAVASILLKRIKQSGFTLHIWGTSEYGKTVACMVGQSIFGNPEQNAGKGIGINFNFTSAGLEYRLGAYNNIPLFINEMQHQKDAKDYDKILFLVAEGKGKSKSTKNGGIARDNYWNNIVITNGEKNIIKTNSNAGAYNRCISLEIKSHSYENLNEVADFTKENYGTVIREILKHINDYDCKAIFKGFLEQLKDVDTTDKQKILVAELMLGDKILTDIIFKDEYYIKLEDLQESLVSKTQIAVEERALEVIKDWYVSEKRHFFECKEDENEERIELYGKKMQDGYVAFIPSIIRDKLNSNGFDYMEVVNAWKRKNYLKCDKDRNTKNVRFGTNTIKCIVLDIRLKDTEDENEAELIEMPF